MNFSNSVALSAKLFALIFISGCFGELAIRAILPRLFDPVSPEGIIVVEVVLLAAFVAVVVYLVLIRPLAGEAMLWREAGLVVKGERTELARLLAEGQRDLERSEGQYKQLVDSAEVIILRWNTTGTITFMNDFGERFFGYSKNAIVGRGVLETIVPPTESFTGRDLQDMITTLARNPEAHSRNENENVRADGTRVWISWTNTALYDSDGAPNEMLSVGIDVTRRRHFEHALARSEARSRSILESVGEGIYGVDGCGVATFCNPAAARMLDYTVEELIGQPVHELIHHSHADGTPYLLEECPIYRAFKGGEDTESKTEIFWRKGGTGFPVELTSTPIYTDGVLSGGVVTFRDVTERNRIQRELRRSEAWNRTVLETVADGIVTLDTGGNITSFNGSAERIFGYARDEVLGHDLGLLLSDGLRDLRYRDLEALDGREQMPSPGPAREVLARRKSGEVFPIEISLAETRLSEERIFTGVIRDVTDRKRAEESLRKLSRAVEASPVSVVITNANGDIEYVNPKFQEVTGYSRAEVIGANPRLLKSNLLDRTFYVAMWDVLTRGEKWQGEFHNQKKDGTHFWERASISPIRGEDGKVTHYVAVKEDITEQRWVAEQLKEAKEEAEAANQAKSTFLANMSHEIRTPLNAIFGYGQLLGRMPLEQKQREYLGTILRSSEHLLSIINDILDLARIESGRTILTVSNFDVNELLRDIGNMFSLRMAEKGLAFEVVQLSEDLRFLRTDQGKLRQVLINLIGNAAKFTTQGHVAIVPRLHQENGKPDLLEISVADTGPGISDEEMTDLFDAFVQTASGRAQQGGTGLGLAISRKLSRAMNGDLTARSEVGCGSTFTVAVPVAPSDCGDYPAACRQDGVCLLADGEPHYRILVADDVTENRQLVVELLTPFGFEVFEARDGHEAIGQFQECAPHLILMDMGMPGMDGYEATRRIKASEVGRATPVIAMTARVLSEGRDCILAAGVDDFLGKPFHIREIVDTIQRHLGAKFAAADGEERQGTTSPVAAPRDLATSVGALPESVRRELKRAAQGGHIKRLGEMVDEVTAIDNILGAELRSMANNFEHRRMLDLLEKAEQSS